MDSFNGSISSPSLSKDQSLDDARKILFFELDREGTVLEAEYLNLYQSQMAFSIPREENSNGAVIERAHPPFQSFEKVVRGFEESTFKSPKKEKGKGIKEIHSPLPSSPTRLKSFRMATEKRQKRLHCFSSVFGRDMDVSQLSPESCSLYLVCSLWARDNLLCGNGSRQNQVILNNEEMKVLTSEILNTERIRNTRPLPRCIFSKTQIDEILKSKQEIAIQELLQLLVCSACNEKIWNRIQYIHRIGRFGYRLRKLLSENNINTMTDTDELMMKYIAKLT